MEPQFASLCNADQMLDGRSAVRATLVGDRLGGDFALSPFAPRLSDLLGEVYTPRPARLNISCIPLGEMFSEPV